MATVTFKGNPVKTAGELPAVGKASPAFTLTGGDLADVTLASFAGKTVVLNIVPSLDTSVCALSAKRFNAEATAAKNTVIVNVSADLPFAQKRFCDAEKLAAIVNLSAFRAPAFGKDYGVAIVDGPLAGLLTRAVVVVNAKGVVAYTELVPEITHEPNYDAALKIVKSLV
jgi:thiol peroxidase